MRLEKAQKETNKRTNERTTRIVIIIIKEDNKMIILKERQPAER